MAVTTIGPVRPVSTIANMSSARGVRAELVQERLAGAIITLVTIGLVLANVLIWAIVAAGS